MKYEIGDFVSKPVTGICKIEDVLSMDPMGGKNTKLYYLMKPVEDEKEKIYVAVSNADEKMRSCLTEEEAWDLLIVILYLSHIFFFLTADKQHPEDKSCKRPYKDQLQWECQDKIFAVGGKIVWYKIGGKAVSVKYTDHTGECNLPDNREGLDCKNNKDWSVSRLHDAESTHFCQMAGYEISK